MIFIMICVGSILISVLIILHSLDSLRKAKEDIDYFRKYTVPILREKNRGELRNE